MDRGLLDAAAYLPQDGAQWREILADIGVNEPYLLGRYDMVLHLRTAAAGAEAHFDDARLCGLGDGDGRYDRRGALDRAMDLDGRPSAPGGGTRGASSSTTTARTSGPSSARSSASPTSSSRPGPRAS
ncbi:hypothetical protein JL720_8918 [Aureococcus anophagefferens]|nr:hypothetical protein JL720_8918 [Aureococcus anophagefferens]